MSSSRDHEQTAGVALDTSGRVAGDVGGLAVWREFEELSPFQQGYVKAALHRLSVDLLAQWLDDVDAYRAPAFRDLAPEALAAMLKDCQEVGDYAEFFAVDPGTSFWLNRQSEWPAWGERRLRLVPRFPPLTLYLGDDGKIYQRETA